MRSVSLFAFEAPVYCLSVCPGRRCNIESSLHPSLYLVTVYSRIQHFRDMLHHAQILGIEYKRTSLILFYGKILPRSALFRHSIFPSAGMGTCASVGIPSCKIVGKKAATRIRDAHGSVDETLYFHVLRNIVLYLSDLLKRQLSCSNRPLRSLLIPEAECAIVCIISLSGNMDIYLWAYTPCDHKHSGIGYYHRIGLYSLKLFKISFRFLKIAVVSKYISGHMDLNTVSMGIGNACLHIFT